MKEHALIYLGESKSFQSALTTLLQQYNFDYTFIGDEDLEDNMLSLFEKNTSSNTLNEAFTFNFIFFKNVNHDKVLNFYKDCTAGNFSFSHKAVMTEHNQTWILKDLLVEIAEEHEYFQVYGFLQNLLKEANSINPTEYQEDSFIAYRDAFIQAYMLSKQKQLTKEEMITLIETILATKQNIIKKDER